MSEYQYYEFQAVDRPLSQQEMRELRAVSTRAEITLTRFVNEYHWGNFKGNPAAWMERYFDAFLYLANWGTRELMLRLPRRTLDLATARRYCGSEYASAAAKGDHVILAFNSDDEDGDDLAEGTGWLSSIILVRAELAAGDHRSLYLAWLLAVQNEVLDEEEAEPPVPPGLGSLTASLQAFADFLRIDGDLITAAAERSAEPPAEPSRREVARWIATLPGDERDALLTRVVTDAGGGVRAELLRRIQEARREPGAAPSTPRTAGELRVAAERCATERRDREAEAAARRRAMRERAEAEARERRIHELAKDEPEAWRRAGRLIGTKQAAAYEEAVQLLVDLRSLAVREGRAGEAEERIRALRAEHSRKHTFVERLKKAGLS